MPSDRVIAKPSDICCLYGNIYDGEPRGTITEVAGIDTYVSKPPKDKANGHILLYFPDVWGFFKNGFLIMDRFADAGFLTLGLDYFRGDPVWKHRKDRFDVTTEPDFSFQAWRAKHTAFCKTAVPEWVTAAKVRFGQPHTKFACVGYCYGAPYVCEQLAEGGICTAGAFAHPAFLLESHFESLEKPLFLSCAETDHLFPNESRNRSVDIMQERGKTFQVQLFSGVEHGFALRGDMSNPYERYAVEQSVQSIAQWFKFWLSEERSMVDK